MTCDLLKSGVGLFAVTFGSAAFAVDVSTWIPLTQAVQTAQQQVAGSTPIKIELDVEDGPLHFEVKTFNGSTLYEIRVNPETGTVFDVDSSDGGGALSDIAEAQWVINRSNFTLEQAIVHAQSLFPSYFLVEIEMENRDNVAIFDMDFISGTRKLEVRMRASNGVILHQSISVIPDTSPLYNLFVPDENTPPPPPPPGPVINVGALLTADQVITAAETAFGGEVFKIELKKPQAGSPLYELRLYDGVKVVKAKYNAKTGTLRSTSRITKLSYLAEVQASLNAATLTLNDAIAAALAAVPDAFVVDAQIRLQDAGSLFNVELYTDIGIVEVKVNSLTGQLEVSTD